MCKALLVIYAIISMIVFSAELFLRICHSIHVTPYIMLCLFLGDPFICVMLLWYIPLFLMPRAMCDKLGNYPRVVMCWITTPILFGIIAAIIDLFAYINTNTQRMFTFFGNGFHFF